MEEELSYSPQDIPVEEGPREENEESKNSLPQKRQKTTEVWSISTAIKCNASAGPVLVVSHTDAQAIEKLKEIERSTLP